LVTERDVQSALCRQFGYPSIEVLEERLRPELYMALAPFSRAAEQLNRILGQLLLVNYANGLAMAISSPDSAEGRSGFAANLAIAYAQAGKKTLLIDADLRKPRQHELFGVLNSFGLSTTLTESDVDPSNDGMLDYIFPTELFGLHLLSAGPARPNPVALLNSDRFATLIEDARISFDVVIIDTPPTQEYVDALMIASLTGNAVIVTKENHSRLGGVEDLVKSAKQRGIQILGTVLAQ